VAHNTRNITTTSSASFNVPCNDSVNIEACLGRRTVSGRPCRVYEVPVIPVRDETNRSNGPKPGPG